MRCHLGIDASTQSVSIILIQEDTAEIVGRASVNFGRDLPHWGAPNGFIPGGVDGEVHADPRMWLEGLERCLVQLRDNGAPLGTVVSVSGAGQQHGTVYLNEAGLEAFGGIGAAQSLVEAFAGGFSRLTSPIWMDGSTTRQCRAIEAAVGCPGEVCARSGSVAIERFSGPQIRRFSEIDPEGWAATARVHLVSSFLAAVCAGRDAPIDLGDGAGMNLLNLWTGTWDGDLVAATAGGLGERLPEVVASGTDLGPVAGWLGERFGIPAAARVIAFTGDNPSSLVGMFAAEVGKTVVSLGTSDTFFAAMPEVRTDPDGFGHVFGNPLGGWMTLQCFANGSLARERVREELGLEWAGFSAAIDGSEPGSRGDFLLPFFGPEISPRMAPGVRGTGVFAEGIAGDSRAARAAVEGQFLNMKASTAWMGLKTDTVLLTGGASRNDAIARIVANIFGAEVRRLASPDSVALGAALRAMRVVAPEAYETVAERLRETLATDPIQPEPAAVAIYENCLGDFIDFRNGLKDSSQVQSR